MSMSGTEEVSRIAEDRLILPVLHAVGGIEHFLLFKIHVQSMENMRGV